MGKTEYKPAIRFQGFTDAWEQRKLGDTFDFLQNNTLSRADLDAETGVAKNVHYGDVLIKFGEYLDASSSALPYIPSQQIVDKFKGSLLQDGDVIMADTAEDEAVGKCTEIAGLQGFPTISGLHTIPLRPKEKFASGYLGYYMNSGSYHNQLLPLMQGIKVTSVSKSAISNTDISFPYDRDEQAEIGGFFIRLDYLITLHQRKYDKLVNIKKSMLEKMFPRDGATVPEIRFTGFTDAWEQRKLGEVGKARSGVGFPDTEQGGSSGIPFFKVSDMNNDGNENEMIVANNYVTDAQIAARRWSPIEEVPAIFFAKVGAAVMLNRKRLCRFPFLLDNNTMAYSLGKDQWDADFAKALFETVDLTTLVQVGALPSYNAGDVEAMGIMLPEIPEQRQIGAYFRQLDNLITLHQRKLEKLKNIKKSMLEKMFV
jgi:type I restriction enzyme S subunit